jgi:hypothetical protein
MPGVEVMLVTGGLGTGKSKAAAKAAAELTSGTIVIRVGSYQKAVEWRDDLERYGAKMVILIHRGRFGPVHPEEAEALRKGDVVELMCGREPALIKRAMRNGVSIPKTFCKQCPLRDGCLYRGQTAMLLDLIGAVIVIGGARDRVSVDALQGRLRGDRDRPRPAGRPGAVATGADADGAGGRDGHEAAG